MRTLKTAIAASVWLSTVVALLAGAAPCQADQPRIDFAHDIVPILRTRCGKCHTNGTYKGSFSLDTREAILESKNVVPGKSDQSELVRRLSSPDQEERMPNEGEPLTARQIALIRAWIDQGLAWEEGFSFLAAEYVPPLKPRKVELPPVRAGRQHPIDRIVDAYYERHQVAAPAVADDATFLRRAYLDLIGLLPAPSEVGAFDNDRSPDKRARLIAKLLSERRAYADHWLSFWNDLLRNDYAGTGYIDGGRKQISAWLYQSLLDNKPLDRFVRELISPTGESEGFIRGIKWRGNVNASQVVELQFSQNVSQVFFGINMKCASCHDSFIDRWKLDDAYALAAVVAEGPLEMHRCDKPLGQIAKARFIFPELGTIDAALPREKRLEQLSLLVTHPENGRFARTMANRFWQRLMGRGIVHPVDVMANRPWSEDLLDYLGSYLADNGFDVRKLLEHIATSQTYQSHMAPIGQEVSGEAYVFRGPEVRRMTAEQFVDAVWMLTGTAPAKAAAPVALPAFEESVPAERRMLRASLVNADALMRSLGRPNREQVVTTRPDSLTTLQALDLSNGPLLAETLAKGAANLLGQQPPGSRPIVQALYLQALSRRPSAEELAIAEELVGSPPQAEGLADLLWAVIMLPEFQLIR